MSKKIIVPFDGSKIAQNALNIAISMAQAYGDEIRLINIQQSHEILGKPIIEEANAILDEAKVPYSTVIRIGTPAIEIISEANSKDTRCIVMGAKGTSMDPARKLGSVTQALLTLASCPIMIIPNH